MKPPKKKQEPFTKNRFIKRFCTLNSLLIAFLKLLFFIKTEAFEFKYKNQKEIACKSFKRKEVAGKMFSFYCDHPCFG